MNLSTVNDASTSPPISLNEPGVKSVLAAHTTFCAINIILGLPSNVYILWLIPTAEGETMASEFFSLNLTISEILSCLFSAFTIADVHVQSDFAHKANAFSTGFFVTSRHLFHCCICIERYLAVIHPVILLKYKPLRYRVGSCSVFWLMVLGSCCLSLFDNFSPVFFYSVFVQSLIYFLLMSFCCLSVLWALKHTGPGNGDRVGTNSIKMKAFKIILIILVYAAVSQLPLVPMILTKSYIPYKDFLAGMVIYLCIRVISGFVHTLLHLHRVGKLPCIRGL